MQGAGDPAADGPLPAGAGRVAGSCYHGTDLIGRAADGGPGSTTALLEPTVDRVPADPSAMQGLQAAAHMGCCSVATSGRGPLARGHRRSLPRGQWPWFLQPALDQTLRRQQHPDPGAGGR